MREIKFRAWDGVTMHSSFDLRDHVQTEKEWVDEDYEMNDYLLAFSPKTILLQFTGLKDKNGKEIYEGDIIQYKSEIGHSEWEVLFHEGRFCHKNKDTRPDIWYECNEIEIIGNIYENQELLDRGI